MMGPVWSLNGGDAATQAVTRVTVPHCAGSAHLHIILDYNTHTGAANFEFFCHKIFVV